MISEQRIRRQEKGLWIALFLALVILAVGTLGYMVIERWNLLDAYFMTVITLATVGYGETHPLSPQGKIFTTGLILAGVGLIAYSLTLVTRTLMEGEFKKIRAFRKMQKRHSFI